MLGDVNGVAGVLLRVVLKMLRLQKTASSRRQALHERRHHLDAVRRFRIVLGRLLRVRNELRQRIIRHLRLPHCRATILARN